MKSGFLSKSLGKLEPSDWIAAVALLFSTFGLVQGQRALSQAKMELEQSSLAFEQERALVWIPSLINQNEILLKPSNGDIRFLSGVIFGEGRKKLEQTWESDQCSVKLPPLSSNKWLHEASQEIHTLLIRAEYVVRGAQRNVWICLTLLLEKNQVAVIEVETPPKPETIDEKFPPIIYTVGSGGW